APALAPLLPGHHPGHGRAAAHGPPRQARAALPRAGGQPGGLPGLAGLALMPTPPCKICRGATVERLKVPADRHPHLASAVGALVPYFACGACHFLFATHLDAPGAEQPYGEDYFEDKDLGAERRAALPTLLARQVAAWLGARPQR